MPERDVVINSVVQVARSLMNEAGWPADSCIAATRVVIETLHHFGIESVPVSVGLVAMNPVLAAMQDAGQLNRSDPTAKVVEVAYRGPVQPWKGHVVAVAATDLIDVTIDQFNRPDYELILTPFRGTVSAGFAGSKTVVWIDCDNGCRFGYVSFPHDLVYQESANWSDMGLLQPVIDAIIDAVQASTDEIAAVVPEE